MLFSEVAGVHVHQSLEVAAEREQVGEAAAQRDLLQRQIGALQQMRRVADATVPHVLQVGGAIGVLAHAADELAGYAEVIRHTGQGKLGV